MFVRTLFILFIVVMTGICYSALSYTASTVTYVRAETTTDTLSPTATENIEVLPPSPQEIDEPVAESNEETISENLAADTTPILHKVITTQRDPFDVPFYSQFADISDPAWQKVGCGIASLSMLISFYEPQPLSVNNLLSEGIQKGAYLESAGWTYAGLISVAEDHGLTGKSYDLGGTSMENAFAKLETALADGPVMVSVHYTFEPTNPIPHLVIATGIEGDTLYYNDPAEQSGGGSLSTDKFKRAWKKRYIEFWPLSS